VQVVVNLIPIAGRERTESGPVPDQGLIIVQVICRVLLGNYFSLRVEEEILVFYCSLQTKVIMKGSTIFWYVTPYNPVELNYSTSHPRI
jgi:hypothetical protein